MMQSLIKNEQRDEDPREATLRFRDVEPMWVLPAYSKTQPKNIFNTDVMQ